MVQEFADRSVNSFHFYTPLQSVGWPSDGNMKNLETASIRNGIFVKRLLVPEFSSAACLIYT